MYTSKNPIKNFFNFVDPKKVFRTSTRGGGNSHARLFLRIHAPHLSGNTEGIVSFTQEIRDKFSVKVQGGGGIEGYIVFKNRQDFTKIPSIAQYLHERECWLALGCWDRDFPVTYKQQYEGDPHPFFQEPGKHLISKADWTSPIFWAVVASSQMFDDETSIINELRNNISNLELRNQELENEKVTLENRTILFSNLDGLEQIARFATLYSTSLVADEEEEWEQEEEYEQEWEQENGSDETKTHEIRFFASFSEIEKGAIAVFDCIDKRFVG